MLLRSKYAGHFGGRGVSETQPLGSLKRSVGLFHIQLHDSEANHEKPVSCSCIVLLPCRGLVGTRFGATQTERYGASALRRSTRCCSRKDRRARLREDLGTHLSGRGTGLLGGGQN